MVTTTPVDRSAAPASPSGFQGPESSASGASEAQKEKESLFSKLQGRLIRLAPKPIVRRLAGPYIAGETREEALALVRRLYAQRGLYSTVDVLGEAVTEARETRVFLDEYVGVLNDLGSCPYANVSIKLSALGQGIDEDLCARNLETLLKTAASHGQFVRFDMEDHSTVDSTLALFRRFVGKYPRIGVVLQSRLFRTPDDVGRLADLKPSVRLCIGIYRERAGIAFQEKPAMKARMLEILAQLWANGQHVGLATHDEKVIRRALAMARGQGRGPASFEVQMLLGVPRTSLQQELTGMGIKVRLYVPYGRQWYQYCLRRLEHNPEMASLVVKNLFRIG